MKKSKPNDNDNDTKRQNNTTQKRNKENAALGNKNIRNKLKLLEAETKRTEKGEREETTSRKERKTSRIR